MIGYFDRTEAIAIETALELFDDVQLRAGLAFLRTYYARLTRLLEKLEERGTTLIKQLAFLDKISDLVQAAYGPHAEPVSAKFNAVIEKNKGLLTMKQIGNFAFWSNFRTS